MKILVTGAAGFIGFLVVKCLLEREVGDKPGVTLEKGVGKFVR